MASLNFPDTSGSPPTDGSFTHTENGLVYSWDGEKWTLVNESDGAGSDYVLPTATAIRLGGIKVGENLSVEPDGTLNAAGDASIPDLQAVTDSGNTTTNGATFGARVECQTSLQLPDTTPANGLYVGQGGAGAQGWNARITGEGAGYFGGNESAGATITLSPDGTGSFDGKVTANSFWSFDGTDNAIFQNTADRVNFAADGKPFFFRDTSNSGPVIQVGTYSGGTFTANAQINADGAANFAATVDSGSLEVHPYNTQCGLLIFQNGSSTQVNVELNQDGSATFKNQIQSLNYRVNQTDGSQIGAYSSGEWFDKSSATENDLVIAMQKADSLYFFDTVSEVDKIILGKDGTAYFASRVNVGASDLNERAVSAYSTSGTVGTVSAANYNPAGILFQGYNASVDDTNATLEIRSDGSIRAGGDPTDPNIILNADGSAVFAGNVISGDASATYFSIQKEGRCEVQAADASKEVARFSNLVTGTTISFQADGSASFAGGNGYTTDNTFGISADGVLRARHDDGNLHAFEIYSGGATASELTSYIRSDGSATFAQGLTVASYNTPIGAFIRSGGTGPSQGCLYLVNNSDESPNNLLIFGRSDGDATENKFQIANDGSAEFAAGNFKIDNRGTITRPGLGGDYCSIGAFNSSGATDGSLGGRIVLNTDNPDGNANTTTITLNGQDGSASFAGAVVITGDVNCANVRAAGFVQSRQTEADASCWSGELNGNSTSHIFASGDASFAGNVACGTVGLNTPYTFIDNEGIVEIRREDDATAFMILKTGSNTRSVEIKGDGSATFAGFVVSGSTAHGGGGGNYFSTGEVAAYSSTASSYLWRGWDAFSGDSNTLTSEITADGKATFKGDVVVGEIYTDTTNTGVTLTSGLDASVRVRGNATNSVFAAWQNSNALQTSNITADGSATFAGRVSSYHSLYVESSTNGEVVLSDTVSYSQFKNVSAGPGNSGAIAFMPANGAGVRVLLRDDALMLGTDAINDPKVTIGVTGTVQTDDAFVSRGENAQDYCFQGIKDGTETSHILNDGSATFAGTGTFGSTVQVNGNPASVEEGAAMYTNGMIVSCTSSESAITWGPVGSGNTGALRSDGGAIFGTATASTDYFRYSPGSNNLQVRNTGSQPTLLAYRDAVAEPTFALYKDGSAVFGGHVILEWFAMTDARAWDLLSANYWLFPSTANGSTLLAPSNVFDGMSGLIKFNAVCDSAEAIFKYPDNTPVTYEVNTIVPYVVDNGGSIYLGYPTGGYA